jgi:epoxide hydrolase-like predicted phosphatase
MIKAVIFDVGDVLINRSPVLGEVLGEFNLKKEEIYDYYLNILKKHECGKIDESTFWDLLRKRFNITKPIPRPSPLIRKYEKEIKINQGVLNIALRLKKKNYLVATLSNIIPSHVEHLRRLGLFKHFDVNILSCEVGFMKPHKEIYKTVLKRLKILPEEAVFIDNNESHLQVAEEIGIKTVLFSGVDELTTDLSKLGVK